MVRLALSPANHLTKRRYDRNERLDLRAPLLWTIPHVLTPAECREQIERIEAAGPVDAPITTATGFEMRPDIRNNTRVMVDDVPLAADLYARILSELPPLMHDVMRPVGANERIRYYRYAEGQRFAPHYDGCYARSPDEESLFTFIVYLNDDFTGGETDFPELETTVVPEAGTALLFQHRQLHEGCRVTSGVKYVLRTDVMYRAGA
jgi:predicted 2-oxoglutarate/Fe(II)-dependent dioxygenase YbiX